MSLIASEPAQAGNFSMDCPKILVFEDSKVLAIDIRNSLLSLGYAVSDIIDSGSSAIEKVAETQPNLVLMDICLAGDIDAIAVGNIIRTKFHIPVLYLMEYTVEPNLYQNHRSEPFSHIFKPFAEKDLHNAVEMALYKHHIETKFEVEQQRMLSVINSMGSAVVITGISGDVQVINRIAETLTGWKEEEVIGKHITQVLKLVDNDTGEEIDYLVRQAIKQGQVLNLPENCVLINKNGDLIPIGDNVAPIRDRDGNITGAVIVFQDISQRKQKEEHLVRNAFYDALTSLPNRVLFLDRLRQVFERAKRRNNYHFAVMFLDLDGFKGINDRYGHSMGDDLLVHVASRLNSCVRSGDTVARFGGDEFAVLLEDIKNVHLATSVAIRIQESFKEPLHLKGYELIASASIGIALSSKNHEEPLNLLNDADIAMYRAKQQGKAQFAIFS
ncbi:response regulator receiver modulated diguanylate cyclase with PAS/PAC sensor [Rivularia sp. IAM M-261]|nr:response regulator receiver modulated diguanylate cyclase with PAS/PAC sensor [Rivularia sp. IAM M-261]